MNRSIGGGQVGLLDPAILVKAFSHAPVGVGITDADGRFVAVNDELARLLDRPMEHIVGRPFLTFVHPEERAASLAGYFVSVVAAVSQRATRPGHAELRCLTGRGSEAWFAVTWTITEPDSDDVQYGIVHMTDVTERREVQRRLARAEQAFQLAFDCAPIGIAVVNRDGRLLQVNRALVSMLGYEQAELAGAGVASIFHPGERRRTLDAIERLLSGELDMNESVRRLQHRDGHTVQARCILASARDPDGAFGHLLIQVENLNRQESKPDRLDLLQLRDRVTGLPTEQVMAAQVALTWGIPRSLVLIGLADLPGADETLSAGREEVLNQLARIFTTSCRDGDLLARVSDHEFAIVVEDAGPRSAETLGERISAIVSDVLTDTDGGPGPAIRVGIARDEAGTKTLGDMLHQARAAASEPATAPPPRAIVRPTMTPLSRVLALENDLVSALRGGEISLVYQPIVDLCDGSLHSAEALSRWRHPVLGDIAPAEFVPIAERSPAIHMLTQWVVRSACAQFAGWKAAQLVPAPRAVAVNVSAQSFAATDFPAMVIETLTRAGLGPRDLILEITETAAADATTGLRDNAAQLHEFGVRIALDDFGAGYSSLARLVTLPFTELKLDRTLTAPGLDASVSGALLRSTVSMSADLGVDLIAEGIETPAQLELLRRHGCPFAQGYLLGPPQKPEDIESNGFAVPD